MLPRTSLGSLGLIVGGVLSVIGFVAYFSDNATLNLVGFFYGIPLLLGGFALKAAELKPVPMVPPTPDDVVAVREQQATPTQKQIRKDVTRYRYGQEAHLDTTLEYLGLSPTDEERPNLESIREECIDNAYRLVLTFDSPLLPFDVWAGKQEKIERFFGPGVRAVLNSFREDKVELALVADPSINHQVGER
ncbi:MAG: DUF2854 domain-containing protein [Synechococcales bacterium]|nr:DUF2854 domain-containing protein [Synechococcales bacterium]